MKNLSESIQLHKPTRQARLRAWMIEHGVESRDLARAVGISPQMMSMITTGERAPKDRIERLVELGVPRDLLPPPYKGRKRGPKPRTK
ncbi:hypothetical protein JCM16814_17900 [Desulfobaculum senezii]